jgi:hypothetical protein
MLQRCENIHKVEAAASHSFRCGSSGSAPVNNLGGGIACYDVDVKKVYTKLVETTGNGNTNTITNGDCNTVGGDITFTTNFNQASNTFQRRQVQYTGLEYTGTVTNHNEINVVTVMHSYYTVGIPC